MTETRPKDDDAKESVTDKLKKLGSKALSTGRAAGAAVAKSGAALVKKKPADSSKDATGEKGDKPASTPEEEIFLREVTDELQRERAAKMLRTYGPYGLAAVLLIVLGAAVNEYVKSSRTSAAREAGSALVAAADAPEAERAAAFEAAAAELEGAAAVIAKLQAARRYHEVGDPERANAIYMEIAADEELAPELRDLARIRAVMTRFEFDEPSELIAMLKPLKREGGPYRALALELEASAYLKLGDREAARLALQEALALNSAPQGVRTRVQALIAAIASEPAPPPAKTESAPEESAPEAAKAAADEAANAADAAKSEAAEGDEAAGAAIGELDEGGDAPETSAE